LPDIEPDRAVIFGVWDRPSERSVDLPVTDIVALNRGSDQLG
jgi:hypothetical protein